MLRNLKLASVFNTDLFPIPMDQLVNIKLPNFEILPLAIAKASKTWEQWVSKISQLLR